MGRRLRAGTVFCRLMVYTRSKHRSFNTEVWHPTGCSLLQDRRLDGYIRSIEADLLVDRQHFQIPVNGSFTVQGVCDKRTYCTQLLTNATVPCIWLHSLEFTDGTGRSLYQPASNGSSGAPARPFIKANYRYQVHQFCDRLPSC